jgi:hypothetical protein
MKYITIYVIVLLLAVSAASAGEVNERGAYIGGAVGATTFDDDGAFSGLNFDDSDTSLGIYGGYKFFKYFAVEARLMDLGSYRLESFEFDTWAFSVNAVGIIPFGQSGWELFGQLGLGQINLDAGGIDDEDETVGSAGIGVRFTPIRNLSMALQIDAYAWEDDSLGQTFDVSIATTQFSMQYNF